MIQWFWLISLFQLILLSLAVYRFYKSNWKSKLWGALSILALLFWAVSPVKLDVNVEQAQNRTNQTIAKTKELPDRVTDSSFKDKANSVEGITKTDLQ